MIARRLVAALLVLGAAGAASFGWQEMRRADAAAGDLPGVVDVGFAQSMRAHHEQAVLMAQILLDRGGSRLVALARQIQHAQLIEIGEMKGWLLLWNRPLLPATKSMDWMLAGRAPPDAGLRRYLTDCKSAPGGMPGLASSAELNQLRTLEGEARDRLFLQLMVRHHQGALPMAHFAARNAQLQAVRSMAAEIEMQQAQELAAMSLLLGRVDERGRSGKTSGP